MYIDLLDLSDLGLLVLGAGGIAWLIAIAIAWIILHHYCGDDNE